MKNNYLLMAIIAILALVVVKFAFFGGYDERSVERLVKKGFSHKNYSMDIIMKSGENSSISINCNLKRKKDVYVYEMSATGMSTKIYMDIANDDVVVTMLNFAFVGHISDLGGEYSVDKMDQSESLMKTLKEENIKFKYLGIEEYDSKKCIHFELAKEDGTAISDKNYKEEIYVDKTKGSIERIVSYDKNDKVLVDADFDVEFNVVEDKDVAKPSTSGLTVMNLSQFAK